MLQGREEIEFRNDAPDRIVRSLFSRFKRAGGRTVHTYPRGYVGAVIIRSDALREKRTLTDLPVSNLVPFV